VVLRWKGLDLGTWSSTVDSSGQQHQRRHGFQPRYVHQEDTMAIKTGGPAAGDK
jgi:hypothetical protein